MKSKCLVIFDFCELHENQTNHSFQRKFHWTESPPKCSEMLRLMSNLDDIFYLIYNDIPTP